jgi:hypothetical protein
MTTRRRSPEWLAVAARLLREWGTLTGAAAVLRVKRRTLSRLCDEHEALACALAGGANARAERRAAETAVRRAERDRERRRARLAKQAQLEMWGGPC